MGLFVFGHHPGLSGLIHRLNTPANHGGLYALPSLDKSACPPHPAAPASIRWMDYSHIQPINFSIESNHRAVYSINSDSAFFSRRLARPNSAHQAGEFALHRYRSLWFKYWHPPDLHMNFCFFALGTALAMAMSVVTHPISIRGHRNAYG